MKHQYSITAVVLASAMLFAACRKSDDYKKYQSGGEIPYPGIMDSVKIMAGKNRVMVTGLFTSDPKIALYRLFWNNRQDSLEVPVTRKGNNVDTARMIIGNLTEGAISIEVRTYDAKGNKSIPVFAVGNVYGAQYESGVGNRSVAATAVTKNGLKITWAAAPAGSPFTRLRYTAAGGAAKEIKVPAADESTTLADYRFATKMLVNSAYLPEPGVIDTFYAAKADTVTKANGLAGVFVSSGVRTNYTGPAANNVVAGTNALSGDKTATELSATKVEIDYANLGGSGWKYVISYDGTTISVAPNATMAAGVAPGSFIVHSIVYDNAAKTISVKTAYSNTAGDARVVEEVLTLK